MIKVIFECGGCAAKAEGTLRRHFESITGRSYGFGTYRYDTPQDVAPPEWIAFDPYTGCTYCPACWASIVGNDVVSTEETVSAGDKHE